MFLRLMIVALAIASVNGQTQNKCINNAYWDEQSESCKCSSGLYGPPDLCCIMPLFRLGCFAVGDPTLYSFYRQKIGMDFPCGTLVSSTKMPGLCSVNVYSASKEMRLGSIYTSNFIVQLKDQTEVTLTFNFDQAPATLDYKQNGVSTNTDIVPGKTKINKDGLLGDIFITFSPETNLVTVEACQAEIAMRPAAGDNPKQARTPGLCVMTSPSAVNPSITGNSMCGLQRDLSAVPGNEYLAYAIKPMKNYIFNNGILKKTTSNTYLTMCSRFQDTMINGCDSSERENAMKKCAFLLFQPTIRRCFYEAGSSGSQLGRSMRPFLDCLDTYCRGTEELCEKLMNDPAMKACGQTLLNCKTWMPYRRNNRVIAGENGQENFGQELPAAGSKTTQWAPADGEILGNDNNDQVPDDFDEFNPDDFI